MSPHSDAGMRTEPPASDPIAAGASPAATATAEPLDEPPGTRCVAVSHGFHGVPIGWLRPQPPNANSTMCVLPSGIMPAAIRRSTAVAVSSDAAPSQLFEPAVVCRPARCSRSFERHRQAVQRAAGNAGLALEVGRLRAGERASPIDVDERVQVAVEPRDAGEAGFHDLDRRLRTTSEGNSLTVSEKIGLLDTLVAAGGRRA